MSEANQWRDVDAMELLSSPEDGAIASESNDEINNFARFLPFIFEQFRHYAFCNNWDVSWIILLLLLLKCIDDPVVNCDVDFLKVVGQVLIKMLETVENFVVERFTINQNGLGLR